MSQVQVAALGVQRKVLGKGTRSMVQRDLGVIVSATQMSQEDMGRLPVEGVDQKGRQFLVGEMSDSAQNTLLDAPGVGSNFQHLLVMIGFHDEPVTPRKATDHRRCEFTQIGDKSSARLRSEDRPQKKRSWSESFPSGQHSEVRELLPAFLHS